MLARNSDPKLLHPLMRTALVDLLRALEGEGIPLRLYEGWRSPDRQAALFARGRVPGSGVSGKRVTNARAWDSYHQYGLAVDLVFWSSQGFSWQEARPGLWDRYHQLARASGLQPLSFEKPHIQIGGLTIADMRAGRYPPAGDESWAANLDGAVLAWGSADRTVAGLIHPGAPAEVWSRPPEEGLPA